MANKKAIVNELAIDKAMTSQDLLESVLAILAILFVCSGFFYAILFIGAIIVLFIFLILKYRKLSRFKSKRNKSK
ncbi:MAG: hypothetical protein ABR981_01355 [Candidatus Micrarchaeaceae archaeon]|jgi:hypothetical protein